MNGPHVQTWHLPCYGLRPWSCLRCGVRRVQREPVCAWCMGRRDLRSWALRPGLAQALVALLLAPVVWVDNVRQRAQFVGFLAKRLRFDIGPGVPAPSCASFTSAFVVWGHASLARSVVEWIAGQAGERVFWVNALVPAVDHRVPAKPVQHGPGWACVSSGAHPGLGRVECVNCGKRIEWASWFARRCSAAGCQ